jgi:hypothetical protein
MENGHKPPGSNARGKTPGVATGCLWMSLDIKDLHNAIPNHPSLKTPHDRDGLPMGSATIVSAPDRGN